MPQYQHVFVKASKSHTEQVIDVNFNIMLNEMTNGDTYYVSDNGRIRKKTGYSRDDVRYTDQSQRSLNNGDHYEHYQAYGGARPKSTQRYGHGPTYGNTYRDNDYGRTRVSTHPSSHTRYGDITRRPEARRCHTPRGSSTIDYAILSMGLFPYIVDFYFDIYDKCLSDVHCPVCIVMSGKNCSTIENNIGLVTHNEYLKTKHVKIAWKQELSNQYTQSFNVKEIEQFQSKLTHIMSEMDHVTQHIIDTLYTDMKTILIHPTKVTDMYKQYTLNSSYHNKRTRRHDKKTWFNTQMSHILNIVPIGTIKMHFFIFIIT